MHNFINYYDKRSCVSIGNFKITEPTLSIERLKFIHLIFEDQSQVYDTPDLFDKVEYIVINGKKFKRIED